jgi:hypothetical protein
MGPIRTPDRWLIPMIAIAFAAVCGEPRTVLAGHASNRLGSWYYP